MASTTIRITTLAALLAATTPAQSPATFGRELDNVENMIAKGSWRSAERGLQRLLENHAGAPYALEQRGQICEAMRRCRFQLEHRPPRPERLISGKLVHHDRRSRALELRYGPRGLDDFDRDDRSGALFHPAVFTGPYTVTVSGNSYPTDGAGVRLFVCVDDGSLIDIIIGYTDHRARRGVAMRINQMSGGQRHELVAEQESPLEPGERYRIHVEVGSRDIVVKHGHRVELMRARRPADADHGRFGIGAAGGFAQLSVKGTAGPGWLQGKVDAEVQRQLAQFEQSYDPRDHLPTWLFDAAAAAALVAERQPAAGATRTEPAERARNYPGEILPEHHEALEQIARLIRGGRHAAARDAAEALAPDEAPPVARSYLLALCLSALDEPEAALQHCDAACRGDETFAASHGLRARILAQLRRHVDAVQQLRDLVEVHPDHPDAYRFLSLLLLELGRPQEAMDALQTAREHGVTLPDMATLTRTLGKALRGPGWGNSYRHQSAHYDVRSNVDQRACVESARVLEQAYLLFQSQLTRKARSTERFRVYIFASQSGFDSYCRDVLGATKPHSLGLYSSVLKQLLIWNVPDYGDMLETVRHEGLHQYLDLVMDDPPVWLNEGLAEYYEVDESTDGRPRGGAVRHDLLARLDPDRLVPLSAFLEQTPHEFYANAGTRYGQAWALVHLLRKTTAQRREQFRRLFGALCEARSNRDALREALRGDSLAELDQELRSYVRELKAQPSARPR